MNNLNKCQLVRETCQWVVANSHDVSINESQFEKAHDIHYKQFDDFLHHSINGVTDEQYLNFLFVVDAMNFCFWPKEGLEYDFLAASVKKGLVNGSISILNLSKMTSEKLATEVF